MDLKIYIYNTKYYTYRIIYLMVKVYTHGISIPHSIVNTLFIINMKVIQKKNVVNNITYI